jgi:hypothetical protein
MTYNYSMHVVRLFRFVRLFGITMFSILVARPRISQNDHCAKSYRIVYYHIIEFRGHNI